MSLFVALVAVLAADPHPFTVHDMLAMQRVSDPAVSPDGKRVAFTVRDTDLEANKGRTDVWITDIDGNDLKRLTDDPANDSSARWSGDGSILFLSTRSGSSQVWRVQASGGAAEQVTKLPLDVEGFVPFDGGKRLVLVLDVYTDLKRETVIAETAARDEAASKSKVKAKIYESLPFRHWDTWADKKRCHVFTYDVASGTTVDLMQGIDADAPTKPFGGTEEIAVSPDGSVVVFACQLATRDMMWTTNIDLYAVPTDGSAAPRLLTVANKALDNQPRFSPDGKQLAYLAMARPGYEADRTRVVLMDWTTKTSRVLTEGWDRSATEIAWSKDQKTLYTTADNLGQKSLFAIDASSGTVKTIVKDGSFGNVAEADGRLVFTFNTLRAPDELYSCGFDGVGFRATTKFNVERLDRTKMGDYEQFTFKGAKDDTVYGYLVKPIDFDPAKKYPVAFLIHGGPQGSFGNHFHYRWNPQVHAAAGFAAIMIDFHASTGYGQAFVDAVNHDWGGAPYQDLMLGLDHALKTYTFLDGSNVAALGASYGGYMVNWISGNTDRFKCLVNHDGNIDERMAYFDTEELWFPEWEHGGTPWDSPESYAKHNPIDLVKNWKTPMLVIHGGLDYRVVDTQGMSTFTALQRKGIPSKFLYFPDENHWVLKPQNSILWHETVLEWTSRWTKTAASSEKVGGTPGR
ncbi:MAG: S9 family peptidase [Planctomycetota bacterium]|nr:S9 family peptidase [Planctomycetota bacterium]